MPMTCIPWEALAMSGPGAQGIQKSTLEAKSQGETLLILCR